METKQLFELGQVVMTKRISIESENNDFAKEINIAFNRYIKGDWGNLCDSDKKLNDVAIEKNDDRILAKYNTSKGDIYIITEWDRSYTTILFTDEY